VKLDLFGSSILRSAFAFAQEDRLRRFHGTLLDAAGLGPVQTPYRILHAEAGMRLHAYDDASCNGPALLLVPAPIKRCYIWDLAPEISVVRQCMRQGMRTYLAEWIPLEINGERGGLRDYADRLLSVCADAIAADANRSRIILIGHSLGGTLAAIFACLHPERVRSLALLVAPLHFGADAGSFAPLVAAGHDAATDAQTLGHVPGSFLNLISIIAAPAEFQWRRYLDLLFCAGDYQALATHMRVERWLLDEFQMPGKLFAELIDLLYYRDALMQGTLRIGGKRIGPGDLTIPLLNVVDPRSDVVPPESVVPFHDAATGSPKKLLSYDGDIGVAIQHVGALVGRRAHARLWPAVFEWLSAATR
jgi:polyhydroxyalkanoate synthase